MTVQMKLLFRDGITTAFMQHADVFEKFKVAIGPVLIATLEAGRDPIEVAEKVREASLAPAAKGCSLVAAWNADGVYYQDPTVKAVSTGGRWATLEDFISITVTTKTTTLKELITADDEKRKDGSRSPEEIFQRQFRCAGGFRQQYRDVR